MEFIQIHSLIRTQPKKATESKNVLLPLAISEIIIGFLPRGAHGQTFGPARWAG